MVMAAVLFSAVRSLPVRARFVLSPLYWIPLRFPPSLTSMGQRALSSVPPPSPATSPRQTILAQLPEAETVHPLKTAYIDIVVPNLTQEFSYKNISQVPKIEKILVSCNMGDGEQSSKVADAAIVDFAMITGQWPGRKTIASYKRREGTTVGLTVTLRGNAMYSFLDRLMSLGLPRTRDFHVLSPNSFDGHGNYRIAFRDDSVFSEFRFEELGKQRGMDVCITTTAKTDQEAHRMLSLMGMPFKEGEGPTVLTRKKKKKPVHFQTKSRGRK